MLSEMHSAWFLHADKEAYCHASDQHRQAVHHAQQAMAFAGLTQRLQEQLQASQSVASQQLTNVIAQGRYEVQAWESLANHEHNRALNERNAFVAESNVARHNVLLATDTQRGMRMQLVHLQNRLGVQEGTDIAFKSSSRI